VQDVLVVDAGFEDAEVLEHAQAAADQIAPKAGLAGEAGEVTVNVAFFGDRAQQFDVVFLDPPRYAKSPFGVVDLVNDYPALFKPALLATAEGGTLICCNNVAQVERAAWIDQLERSARKAGRPIREIETIEPEADFPSPDGKPPLKIALLRV